MDHRDDFFNELSLNSSIYEEDLLREILHQPSFSAMSGSINTITTAEAGGGAAVTSTDISSLSLDDSSANQSKQDSPSSGLASLCNKQATSSSQSTYILSFDNSVVIPATANDNAGYKKHELATNHASSLKWEPENNHSESKAHQKIRKSRSSSESLDHIMSERKRRQELSEKFIALSATIPGLKKIDKSTVLSEAISYIKKLKERARELEEQNKKISGDSKSLLISSIKKPSCPHHKAKDDHHHHHHQRQDTISSSETVSGTDNYCFRIINKGLPEVEARVLHNQVLIRIHCKIHESVMLTLFAQLKSLHFTIVSSSVLNFANSELDMTIIAEVKEHKIAMKEVVEKLRLALLGTSHNQ